MQVNISIFLQAYRKVMLRLYDWPKCPNVHSSASDEIESFLGQGATFIMIVQKVLFTAVSTYTETFAQRNGANEIQTICLWFFTLLFTVNITIRRNRTYTCILFPIISSEFEWCTHEPKKNVRNVTIFIRIIRHRHAAIQCYISITNFTNIYDGNYRCVPFLGFQSLQQILPAEWIERAWYRNNQNERIFGRCGVLLIYSPPNLN